MSDAKIIDGQGFSALLRAKVAEKIRDLRDFHRIQAGLAVILVGADPASQIYVRNKVKHAEDIGMKSFAHFPDPDISQEELLLIIEGLNDDPDVHGILVQLPLPDKFDTEAVLRTISPAKDVDGFHPYNAGMLMIGGDGLIPCTPYGCLMLLKDHFGPGGMAGKRAVVVGRSNIVGKPMAQLLLQQDCTVVMTHSRTRDLAEECRRADILVAAVGRPDMIKGDWIKPGAVVIDVGINRIGTTESGKAKLAGDVEFKSAVKVASAITPVPGGVGPMTIAVLLRNTVVAAIRQHEIDDIDLSDL